MALLLLTISSQTLAVVASIGLGAVMMLLSLAIRAVINSNSFKRSNSARGHELFRMFFLGPDFALLAVGLFVSSQALRALLNGHGIPTNFGADFGTYFWAFLIGVFVFLVASAFCWLPYDDNERCFLSDRSVEQRPNRLGGTDQVEIYRLRTLEVLKRPSGIVILVIGNLLGIITILAYAYFIVQAFSPAGR